jgi:CNT family concentrative nucleoside transporter
MTVGMATVAGTVMALYASFLESSIPGAAGHVLIASIMSAPAALLVARLMVPWSREADGPAAPALARDDCASAMDAIARGTADGVRLLVGVTAMLIVAVALVTLVNMMLGALTEPLGSRLTIEQVLGWAMAPVAFLIGIPWSEAATAGQLIGIKTVLNELIAYLSLAEMPATTLSPRSRLILLYALCGFANFGSLGIMTGGLVAMCPERRAEILELAPRTIVSGTLATLMTGAVIGVLRLPG